MRFPYAQLTVGVIGCGSVGGRVALHLARLDLAACSWLTPKTTSLPACHSRHWSANRWAAEVALVVQRCKAINPTMEFSVPRPSAGPGVGSVSGR